MAAYAIVGIRLVDLAVYGKPFRRLMIRRQRFLRVADPARVGRLLSVVATVTPDHRRPRLFDRLTSVDQVGVAVYTQELS